MDLHGDAGKGVRRRHGNQGNAMELHRLVGASAGGSQCSAGFNGSGSGWLWLVEGLPHICLMRHCRISRLHIACIKVGEIGLDGIW